MVSRAVFVAAGGSVARTAWMRDSMDCDLVCSGGLDGKGERAGDQPGVDEEKRHRFGNGRRLHHDGGELIDAVHDLGELAEHRLELFNFGVQSGSVFKFQAG